MSPPSSLLLFLLIIFLLAGESYSQSIPTFQFCSGATYTSPSSYETNLKLLLANLTVSTAYSPSLYSIYTIESPPFFQAYGLAQCRPDSSATVCAACLTHAAAVATSNAKGAGCGRKNSAAFRYDYCLLRYSDIPFFGIPEESRVNSLFALVNASDYPVFRNRVQGLMSEIVRAAASAKSRFAAASANDSGHDQTGIYGMAWCTMDLQSSDCINCLNRSIAFLRTGRVGGEVLKASCTVRFSTSQFIFLASIPASHSPAPTLPIGLSGGNTTELGGKGRVQSSTKNILIYVFLGAMTLIFLFAIFLIVMRRMRRMASIPPIISSNVAQSTSNQSKDMMRSIESLLLDLDAIRSATNNFSKENMLGEGGFGVVYKGTLEDGQEIAVKRLSKTSKQGVKQLRNEMVFMVNLQHRNLVKLFGCCLHNDEKLLVYEYLPNNSLEKYLSDPIRGMQLDWRTRYKIIEGIGRGLLYLHEDSRLRIVHRDLKASNILLDLDMNPKISDFGIAKIFNKDETLGITSQVAGTYGYMSPEYALHGNYSPKSDVYSYGVLVLEIISGRNNRTTTGSGSVLDLLSHVWQCWNQGMALEVIDQSLEDRYSSQEALRCINIGLLCIQEDPTLRPSMSSLVAMLTTNSVKLSDPLMPAFLRQIL